MEKNILWNTLIDENVYLRVTNSKRIKKKNFNTKKIEKQNENVSITLDEPDIINKINQILNYEDDVINSKSSLHLLKDQELVTSYLSRYFIQNTKLNYTFVLTKVLWLMKISKILALRINQKIITHAKNKKKILMFPDHLINFVYIIHNVNIIMEQKKNLVVQITMYMHLFMLIYSL